MNQISLDLPIQINLKLKSDLYYRYEKIECGIISQLALNKGNHDITAIHKNDLIYKIISKKGESFFATLQNEEGKYNIVGFANHITKINKNNLVQINSVSENGKSLRKAQIGAVYSLLAHWSLTNDPATIVLPTGTGKTETMLTSVLADKASKVLVIVPTIELKNQITDKFSNWGILRELGVINNEKTNPIILTLNKIITNIKNIEDINSVDVVISTPGLIARASEDVLKELKKSFSHVFFDEAHHIEAKEWNKLKLLFQETKIVQFTATPYRNDKKPIEGKIVYNYSLARALKDNCFSKISLISVDERHPQKKDEAIAKAAVAKLNEDRLKGFGRHKMMVRTESATNAENLFLNYKEWFPQEKIIVVHSKSKNKKKLIEDIKNGEYDIVICVDMLKEGFDFPDFKIAAVHKLHKSLAVLLQFIGRFTRTQEGLGDASFIVNFAEEYLSLELENLLQEGSGWENVISEIADARKENAESLLTFLQGCQPFSGFDSPNIELNPKLVFPALSFVCYKSDNVKWENFKDAFNLNKYALTQPYYNSDENVFYFSTQKREKVKWAKTDKLRDQTWNLIIMHFDKQTKLFYIGYSEKLLDVDKLVQCITNENPNPINGDCVFRSFDSIKRLSIVHAGIFKPANHLHRYSRLSGADVTTELTRWKEGNRCQKSDFVGIGFRDGFPVSVGASVKGKIWSPARIGDVKQWKEWCLNIGKLITDESIDSNQLLENSAEKTQITQYPKDLIILASDWAEELYDKIHKISINTSNGNIMLSECYLKNIKIDVNKATFKFNLPNETLIFSILLGGEKGHSIEGLDDCNLTIEGLKSEPIFLKTFFEQNPPTIFLINGCTISGCIHTNYNISQKSKIPKECISILDWADVNYTVESMYKKGIIRNNSIQEYVMKQLLMRGAKVVFNDDNSGESADIVAIFQDEHIIRFEMIHCKYSKAESGSRLNDLFEVCGQAIVSLRYKWKPEELLKHLERRDSTGVLKEKRFYHGSKKDIDNIRKALRYTNVEFEFAIAQPGVKTPHITDDMMEFLGSIYSTVVEMTETKLKCYFNS
ncbi:DEAD/DEAH box helicase [Empedobacter falsenii]